MPKAIRPLPAQADLIGLLEYDPLTGYLTWRERSRNMFRSQRAYSTWNARYAGQRAFTAQDAKGYHIGAINDVNFRANRVIWKLVHGVDPIQVDHENGIKTDDRLGNLRDVTSQQNQQNMARAANNTSGHTGVTWDASKQLWAARIKANGKHINLGRFKDITDAVACRKQAEIDYGFHKNHGR